MLIGKGLHPYSRQVIELGRAGWAEREAGFVVDGKGGGGDVGGASGPGLASASAPSSPRAGTMPAPAVLEVLVPVVCWPSASLRNLPVRSADLRKL